MTSKTEVMKVEETQLDQTLPHTTGSPYHTDMTYERRLKVEKKLKLKLDLRFSILVVIYILNYIDRNNASQARLAGFERDLGLKGEEFATVLSIVYVGYILMQVPSNMILSKISYPSWYIAAAMLIWGMISVVTGVCRNFTDVLVARFFLGFVEAVFLPGALFMLSKWYTKKEIALRYTILFCGNLISNAFGSLIAAGILNNMEGVLGHAAWRWLFFIEGALTMGVAVIAGFMLPDMPHNSKGFTKEELDVAQLRLYEDTGESDTDGDKQPITYGLQLAFRTSRLYVLMLGLIAVVTGLSFNAYFPTLAGTLGYDRTKTLLLCAPPWVFSCLVALVNSWHADKTQEKFWHSVWPIGMGIVGFVISIATMNTAARYLALFLQAGSYAGYVIMYSWMASSFPRPPALRAVAIALLNAVSQLGNIAGSYVWSSQFGPTYRNSYIITLCCFVVGIGCNLWFSLILRKMNRQFEEAERQWEEAGEDHPVDANTVPKGFRFLS